MPHCVEALQKVYDRLDVHFDVWLGESAYDEMLSGVKSMVHAVLPKSVSPD